MQLPISFATAKAFAPSYSVNSQNPLCQNNSSHFWCLLIQGPFRYFENFSYKKGMSAFKKMLHNTRYLVIETLDSLHNNVTYSSSNHLLTNNLNTSTSNSCKCLFSVETWTLEEREKKSLWYSVFWADEWPLKKQSIERSGTSMDMVRALLFLASNIEQINTFWKNRGFFQKY